MVNCVLVKVKRLRNNPYRKLLSDARLFQKVNMCDVDCVSYSTDHNLDEDSWFAIDDFSEKPYCLSILKEENFDSKDYENLERDKFKEINYLISVQSDDFYFQNITSSTFVRQKGIIFFGEAAQLEEDSTRLVIKETPDAIYFKDSDTLIFKNLATINAIFQGIDTLYQEATQAEVDQFLAEKFIKLGDGYDAKSVSKPNRKRISFALEVLSSLSPNQKTDMFKYINAYCGSDIVFDQDTEEFQINSDRDLKNLIYGLQERYYTTNWGKEKRLANSVKTLA